MIPPFEPTGLLPPGIHQSSWEELETRFGGTRHRDRLLAGLTNALHELMRAGCPRVYLDGSFVTAKEQPGDFDLCYETSGVDPALLSPVFFDFRSGRAAQKAKFGGELFPAHVEAAAGYNYLEFFQLDSDSGEAKGVVALDIQRLL